MNHVLKTFFGGSVEGAVAMLLQLEDRKLTPDERARIKALIDQAAQEGTVMDWLMVPDAPVMLGLALRARSCCRRAGFGVGSLARDPRASVICSGR